MLPLMIKCYLLLPPMLPLNYLIIRLVTLLPNNITITHKTNNNKIFSILKCIFINLQNRVFIKTGNNVDNQTLN